MFKNKTKKMKMVVKFIIFFSGNFQNQRERDDDDDGNGNGSVE